jgi:molybdopterin-guanine dinucleotide biosynthesis protein A
MDVPCSGIILAGGLNTRFGGTEKALLPVGGRRIMDHLYATFTELFDEIILVTNHPLHFLEWDLTIVSDLVPVRSSLTGIHAGLFYSSRPHAFCLACDTPFIKRELIAALLEEIEPGVDIVMPRTAAGFEPLCAVYSHRCLAAAAHHLEQNKFKIQRAFERLPTKIVTEARLRAVDPELVSFFNLNPPADLLRAEALVREGRLHGPEATHGTHSNAP